MLLAVFLTLNKMKNKIKSITEKVPQIATLPDGLYNAVWSGYVIELSYGSKNYQLETEIGVRGIGIKVVVEVFEGLASFDTVNG
jgi:hypothetical protein